ncbi:MAG: hypothetical protein JW719_05555, partial [Pirellulales bacterium]|nr:hypothetical protein [Pirellulales bacterium]
PDLHVFLILRVLRGGSIGYMVDSVGVIFLDGNRLCGRGRGNRKTRFRFPRLSIEEVKIAAFDAFGLAVSHSNRKGSPDCLIRVF